MTNATLETYIETYRRNGVPEGLMRANLNKMGWSDAEINKCVAYMDEPYPVLSPESAKPATRNPSVQNFIRKRRLASWSLPWKLVTIAFIAAGIIYLLLRNQ